LAEKNEPTFRFGILDPLDDEVQKVFTRAWKTSLLVAVSPTSPVRQFSDYGTQFCFFPVRSTI
jgi:hypothetical protein